MSQLCFLVAKLAPADRAERDKLLRRSLELEPGHAPATVAAASALCEEGKWVQARTTLRKRHSTKRSQALSIAQMTATSKRYLRYRLPSNATRKSSPI